MIFSLGLIINGRIQVNVLALFVLRGKVRITMLSCYVDWFLSAVEHVYSLC